MRNHLLLCLLLLLSCQKLDVELPTETIIDTEALTFFTVATSEVNRTPILNEVIIKGVIDEGDCRCLEEVGFFYGKTSEVLFDDDLTYQDLLADNENVTRIEVSQQNVDKESGVFTHSFTLPEVDTTYFFRSYAIFHDDSESKRLERIHLSEEEAPIQVTLKNGWYKKTFIGDLFTRKGAFVVDDVLGNVIVGLGCAFPSLCFTSSEPQPFLKLTFQADEVQVVPQDRCPREVRNSIYNRENPIAFRLHDLVYFGTGFLDDASRKDLFYYDPADCDKRPTPLEMPEDFTARHGALGFSIGDYGYIGLGKKFVDTDEEYEEFTLADFWQYNPEGQTLENQWCQLEITGDDRYKSRSHAIKILTNDGSIIFGGGINYNPDDYEEFVLTDFWKLTPDPANCTAHVEPLTNDLPSLGLDGDGISFTIKDTPYAGLGNLNQEFFKWQNEEWKSVSPFPSTSIAGGVGFSVGNRGYLFTGTKNDGSNTNLSRDLWIYVPE